MRVLIFLLMILLGSPFSFSQTYEVQLTPISISELGGIQSYAVGTHDGEWLIVGGRLDGLHQRQPFAAFTADAKNQELIVVNPEKGKVWKAPLSSLPSNLVEQLSSTNMQFFQKNNELLCSGGYGFSPTVDDHITFPFLTIIDLPKTIKDVKNYTLNVSTFQQFENEAFRVTGGSLNVIDNIFHLVGGHKFMGRYNPMGPNNGPGFIQEYSNEIRRFTINTDSTTTVEFLDSSHDEMHFHRRDYNLVPMISDGERELMIFSGVFKSTSDLPYLYPVSIKKNNYEAVEDFTQYFNHYHCPHLPIFDSENGDMHTIFFGGIAQFYVEDSVLVQDNDVPFVNTIAEIRRNKFGELSEIKHGVTMPGYLGAGSVFILNSNVKLIDDGIIDASIIGNKFQDVGHIYGGIRSTLPNIFWINTGEESDASKSIFKVSIRKSTEGSSKKIYEQRTHLQFYPNPVSHLIRMSVDIEIPMDFSVSINDIAGQIIYTQEIKKENIVSGRNLIVLDNVDIGYGAYYYNVDIGNKKMTRKVIWTE